MRILALVACSPTSAPTTTHTSFDTSFLLTSCHHRHKIDETRNVYTMTVRADTADLTKPVENIDGIKTPKTRQRESFEQRPVRKIARGPHAPERWGHTVQ